MKRLYSKLKKTLIILMFMIFSITPILTGCSFDIRSSSKLRTPSISLSSINKSISWNEISGAEKYDIYLNDSLADTISTGEYDKMVYDFSAILGDSGEYKLYVIATTSSVYRENSNKSNTCTYTYQKNALVSPTTPNANIVNNKITFTINDGVLSFVPLENESLSYKLYIYSNTTGLQTYNLTSKMVNLIENNMMNKGEIYAIRLGYVDSESGEDFIASDIKYYNNISTKYEGYTDNVYLFDGEIHDYYIQNQQELNNLVYYAFINRIEEYNIRISEEYKSSIAEIYQYSTNVDNLNYAVDQGLKNLYETMSYSANNTGGGYVSINGNSYEYTIKISYGGVKECDVSISPSHNSLYSQARSTAYYETTNYTNLKTKYGDEYNDFASDKQFLYTTVTTSEQLYWAVENKITPVFERTNTRAYEIYTKAKNVLREIISDEMTDYEKALSIFDWIAINTQYDYTSYTTPNYSTSITNYPTKLPCFYLEGVFKTGYSVCDGFSKAFSLMCNMLGIDCIRIVGDAQTSSGSGGHAWNKVLFDKDPNDSIPAEYYIVDITWTEIVSDDSEEQLSHTYFGLSDSDVADTHFAFTGRNGKYGNYKADNSLYYYTYQSYTFEGNKYNLVIDSAEDMERIFDYALSSNVDTIEFVIDYDYMVSVYNEYNTTKYKSGTKIEREYYELDSGKRLLKSEYDPSTDTLTYYVYSTITDGKLVQYIPSTVVYNNYKLRTVFQEKVMKTAKFDTQYFFITDENKLRTYDVVDGTAKQGMMLILTQNLLIDNDEEWIISGTIETLNEEGEVAKTIKHLDENNITGEFYLYIEQPILNQARGSTYTEKIENMFNSFATTNVKFTFEFVSQGEVSVNNVSEVVFKMTVSEK